MKISSELFSGIQTYWREIFDSVATQIKNIVKTVPYLFNFNPKSRYRRITENYPDPISSKSPEDLPPRSRQSIQNDIQTCIGCFECEKICPTAAISIETKSVHWSGKPWVKRYEIDQGACILCGLCIEICPPQSLVNSKAFERATTEVKDLIIDFGRGEPARLGREK